MPRVLVVASVLGAVASASALRRDGRESGSFSRTKFAVSSMFNSQFGGSLLCTAREHLRVVTNGQVHHVASGGQIGSVGTVQYLGPDIEGWDPAWDDEKQIKVAASFEFQLADVDHRRLPHFTCEVQDTAHGRLCAKATFDSGVIARDGCVVHIKALNPVGRATYEIGAASDSRAVRLECTAAKTLQVSEAGVVRTYTAGEAVVQKYVTQRETSNKAFAEMRYVEAFVLTLEDFDPKQDGFVCKMLTQRGGESCEKSSWAPAGGRWDGDCTIRIDQKSFEQK